jgi:very-short-patch-repair endonuclease
MRFSPTYSEALLWSRLRARKLGVTFRRQAVIGSSIFDFVAPAARLIVEVDGDAYHAARSGADRRRDEKLGRLGYRVVRVPASLVERCGFHAIVITECKAS